MFTIVEALGDGTIQMQGRTFPVPCLVEDDDGIRHLLLPEADPEASYETVPAWVWTSAHAAGAAALLMPIGNEAWVWMLAEHFIQGRREHHASASFIVPAVWSGPEDGPITYYQMQAAIAEDAQAVAEAIEASGTRLVHLHTHSEFSPLDGLSKVAEIVQEVVKDGGRAVAVTDHGICASHPHLQAECDKAGIKAIFGIEANFVDDRFRRPVESEVIENGKPRKVTDAKELAASYTHLVLWAMTDDGLRNLWAMSTEANRDGFYYRPRMDWDTLTRLADGVAAGTGCLRGPLAKALLAGDDMAARSILARLMDIFPDRLYVEIHTNVLPEQIRLNHALVDLARQYRLPMIASVDSHYPCKSDQQTHQVWMAAQTNSDLQDDADLFAGNQDYHMLTEAEVRQALSYLDPQVVDEAVENTSLFAERCTATLSGKATPPIYSKVGGRRRDVERLVEICLANWPKKVLTKDYPQEVAEQRFEREMKMIIDKEFPGYYLMVSDYCRASREHGVMVGPGRGSGGGSFVAYLADIVELDAVEADLLFERFMTEGRTELPDFDVDFPTSKRPWLQSYLVDKYGTEYMVRVGTHIRLKNKGVIRDLARVLKNTIEIDYKDIDAVCKIIEATEADKAGAGMSWEDLWIESGELLEPYRDKYPMLFDLATRMVGRLKSYGKHAAGMVIATDSPLTGRLPMRMADDVMVAEFDMKALELLGLVKFDLLTLRTIDTIQECVDLIREQRGVTIDVYDWVEEYQDPQVWEEISDGHTAGIFQIETRSGTRLTKRFRPQSLHDLADVITLVRPGPMRSGLTDTYFRRRNGEEPVTFQDPRLETVLAKTYGTLLYQEDIMQTCMVLAGYDSNEADAVRKILGKKQVEKVAEAGVKFVRQATEHGMREVDAQLLWDQMSEFAKYCVSGDTRVHLASTGRSSDGTITAEALYNRINAPLLDPVVGRTKKGEEYAGPCVVCGVTEAPKWMRGACQACYVWRQKFHDTHRGLYGLTVEADGRIRPCRILMVHKHDPAQTWTVTLADGRSITATGNHQHLTPEGLRRVDELQVGDRLVADGGYEQHRYVQGEQRTTVGDRLLIGAINGSSGPDNYGFVDGGFTSLMEWTAQASAACEECGHDGSVHRLERAHLDGNHANNEWINLKMLCVSCHKKHDYAYNGRQRRWGKGRLTEAVPIVSIEPRAVEPVYSVVMDDPHIWIANGIATANSFNRAHAYGYAVLGFWTAWLKFHYPAQFLTAVLSTVDQDRIPEFVGEARRMGFKVLPPDINLSGVGFSAHPTEVRYGLDKIKGIGEKAVQAITPGQPYTSFEDFLARKGSAADAGIVKLLVKVGAFDSLEPNRKQLERRVEFDTSGEANRCQFKDDSKVPLPCGFDWSTEKNPPLVKVKGDWLPKPPPKRCTKACRNFTAPVLDASTLLPYTDAEIRNKEMEMLGLHLSSTPFDDIPEDVLNSEDIFTADDIQVGPAGSYYAFALVTKVRPHTTRAGKPMGFMSLYAQNGELDVTVFTDEWATYQNDFTKGALCLVEVNKNDRGLTLSQYRNL